MHTHADTHMYTLKDNTVEYHYLVLEAAPTCTGLHVNTHMN